jgi:hypothetical protein
MVSACIAINPACGFLESAPSDLRQMRILGQPDHRLRFNVITCCGYDWSGSAEYAQNPWGFRNGKSMKVTFDGAESLSSTKQSLLKALKIGKLSGFVCIRAVIACFSCIGVWFHKKGDHLFKALNKSGESGLKSWEPFCNESLKAL